jgi:hypothetical protein
MENKYRICGGGTIVLGGTKQDLHWIAEVTIAELQQFVDTLSCNPIEDADWRLNTGHVVDKTYLGTDLPRTKLGLPNNFVLVDHPDRGLVPVREFLRLMPISPETISNGPMPISIPSIPVS